MPSGLADWTIYAISERLQDDRFPLTYHWGFVLDQSGNQDPRTIHGWVYDAQGERGQPWTFDFHVSADIKVPGSSPNFSGAVMLGIIDPREEQHFRRVLGDVGILLTDGENCRTWFERAIAALERANLVQEGLTAEAVYQEMLVATKELITEDAEKRNDLTPLSVLYQQAIPQFLLEHG